VTGGELAEPATGAAPAPGWELPVVRARALPDLRGALVWQDGPDVLAAAVVALVGAIGVSLGVSSLAQDVTLVVAAAAVCLTVTGVVAVLAAVGEFLRLERIRIEHGSVSVARRGLAGWRRWQAPLADYRGLEPRDRRRRFHVRNQGRPGGSLQATVTEFVVVLRHRHDAAGDLELFRVQPSLATLRAMHAVRTAGRGGPAAGEACEQAARRYRDALASLCDALELPVLVATLDGGHEAASLEELDLWLQRAQGDASPAL